MQSLSTTSASHHELSTQRLRLRPYTQEVASDFWQLLEENRARLIADFPDRTSSVLTLADAHNRIRVFDAQFRTGELYSYGIWRKENEEYIGDVTLRRLARGKPFAEVGYYIGSKAEGLGYVTEALKAMVRHAFQVLRMESVNLRCAVTNDRSRRVAERCGFTHLKTYTPVVQENPSAPPTPIHVYQIKPRDANAAFLW